MGTEEAGKDGVGSEQGTAKWGAAPIHARSGVSTSFQEKLQHAGCLGFYCQVQRGPATRGLLWDVTERSVRLKRGQSLPHTGPLVSYRFIKVCPSVPEQPDHLCIFVDDSDMEWGVAWEQSNWCQMMR